MPASSIRANALKDWIVATPGAEQAAQPAARAALIGAVFNSTLSIASTGVSCVVVGLATAWRCACWPCLLITLFCLLIVGARIWLNLAYHRYGHEEPDRDRWAWRYAAGALAFACLAGGSAGAAIALDTPTALLVGLGAIGWGGGMAGRNAALPHLAALQCVLLIVPIALGGFWSAEPANIMLAPAAIGYAVALLSFVRHQYRESSALILARIHDAALARRDALTGIANRRGFEERLAEMWAGRGSGTNPIALLLIDIDHFKRYNDLYGHQAGDECLRRVALALRDLLGEDDLIARYGGEEFVMILPDCRLREAVMLARRCCRAVVGLDIEQAMRDDALEVVSVSIGIGLGEAAATGDQLIEMADRALYRAKRGGRNRVYPDSVETVVALRQRPEAFPAPVPAPNPAPGAWRGSSSSASRAG